MIEAKQLINQLNEHKHDKYIEDLYEDQSVVDYQKSRYIKAINKYIELYGNEPINIFSVAGRSEVGGNHTDHQHGRVLAAAINLDAIAVVAKQEHSIKVISDGFDIKKIDLNNLDKKEEEQGSSEALIKGILFKLKELGYRIGGFKAYITSDVLTGAGLSSSAAFEGLIGMIISGLYNQMNIDLVTIAKAGQYAENMYFGKPCGLMDQCACVVGGLISIDFNNPSQPIVNHLDVNFSKYKHSLCIVDTHGSHANLTNEYASIPQEMKMVANYFNKQYLREVDEQEFYQSLPQVRKICGDRSVLRAMHFFNENKRVLKLIDALSENQFNQFKQFIQDSGNSSYKYLQNVYTSFDLNNQALAVALALSENILGNHGVCRVHGGGFAGTIQAFVANEFVNEYKQQIEQVFGKGSCHVLKVRKKGACKVF